MDKETNYVIERLVRELERLRVRLPEQASLGEASAESWEAFLGGFYMACHAFGITTHHSIREYVARERGWSGPARSRYGPIPSLSGRMREGGLSDIQVVDELFAVYIGALKFVADPPADWPTLLAPYS